MAKLVIVESPAKAKTIGKYLGDDYEVTASMGHIRDLPASQLGIDVEHGYAPQYISIKGKEKLIKELKSKAKHADGVLLATDPDREGEAISWHLANILGLDPHEPNRVTFDEITKKGVKEGMAHPRAIDEDLFNAQQARRVLDRLVGYKLSPFLWRKVRRGLSAGRVQSVAVRLIDDREKEIESFKPDEYWNVDATLGAGHKSFTARLATDASGKKLLPKSTKLCCAVGAVATPLLNTFWFMLSLCVFFFNTEYVQSLCATFGTTNPFLFVCAFVGVQALIEAVGCGIVATLVTVPLLKFLKK